MTNEYVSCLQTLYNFPLVLGIRSSAFHMLGKHSITEVHSQPTSPLYIRFGLEVPNTPNN